LRIRFLASESYLKKGCGEFEAELNLREKVRKAMNEIEVDGRNMRIEFLV
jgi:hypothetical protein